jgi:putative tryptophan/tyrosine transport system substrate-binding protein
MQRREFITLLGGAAVAWPRAVRAQQADRMRRVGVLESRAADDPEGKARLAVFAQGLQELGWTDGRNVRIDYRWAAGDAGKSASAYPSGTPALRMPSFIRSRPAR